MILTYSYVYINMREVNFIFFSHLLHLYKVVKSLPKQNVIRMYHMNPHTIHWPDIPWFYLNSQINQGSNGGTLKQWRGHQQSHPLLLHITKKKKEKKKVNNDYKTKKQQRLKMTNTSSKGGVESNQTLLPTHATVVRKPPMFRRTWR